MKAHKLSQRQLEDVYEGYSANLKTEFLSEKTLPFWDDSTLSWEWECKLAQSLWRIFGNVYQGFMLSLHFIAWQYYF